jgi:N-acetylglucosamine kinase-like BadF-type ATPase
MHVLGLDVGGTKTQCLLADGDGRILNAARGPGANIRAIGERQTETVLQSVIHAVTGGAPIPLAAICIGMAGVDRQEDAAVVQRIVQRLVPIARTLVVNDALIALQAGVDDAPGIVIVSGTGSMAYGRNAGGRAARAGGWGYVLGDEGSGYWVGLLALRAVVRATDGRGSPTALTAIVLNHFGVAHPRQLVQEIYAHERAPSQIAALAQYVQAAFDDGDPVARDILQGAARELSASAGSVCSQLSMSGEAFTFLLAGGTFQAIPWLKTALLERLRGIAPRSRVEPLLDDPAVGAVRLALADARGGACVPAYGE